MKISLKKEINAKVIEAVETWRIMRELHHVR